MSDLNSLPFERGATYFNGATTNATDGGHLEGREYLIEDTRNNKTGRYVRLKIVRNVSAAALEPKRLVSFSGATMGEVDGYADVNPDLCYPVDDAYSSTIPVNDLFYVVIEGPCLVKTSLVGDATNVLSIGDFVQNATAASSGATTAGRVRLADMSTTGLSVAKAVLNTLGRALSAKTTNNTDADVLVNVGFRW